MVSTYDIIENVSAKENTFPKVFNISLEEFEEPMVRVIIRAILLFTLEQTSIYSPEYFRPCFTILRFKGRFSDILTKCAVEYDRG